MKVVNFARGEATQETLQPIRGWGTNDLPGRYEPTRKPRWISLGLIAALHAVGFAALQYIDVNVARRVVAPPLVVRLLPLEPPAPEPVKLPTEKTVEREPHSQRVVVVPPMVEMPTAPAAVQAIIKPEPISLPVQVEQVRSEPSRGTETLANLNARLLSSDPPRYPAESRRRRESGTVVLLVLVDREGRVERIWIETSSGTDRLDKAALNAVRRWRWSPTIINGQPNQVRGLVRIPFELKEVR